MAQLVTRVEDELIREIDRLIAGGEFASRSEVVRQGLVDLIDGHRRRLIGEAIVRGYEKFPQTEDEMAWSDRAAIQMIEEEPW